MKENKRRFNYGTRFGRQLIERSIRELGCGRSVLADADGTILAGNDVYSTAIALGKKIVTIETDGDVLVVVKRTDVKAESKKGYELAFVDNLSQDRNLDWNADAIIDTMQECMSFDAREWGGHSALVKELELSDLLKDDVTVVEKRERKEEVLQDSTQLSLFDF